jgi:hypothetical protein
MQRPTRNERVINLQIIGKGGDGSGLGLYTRIFLETLSKYGICIICLQAMTHTQDLLNMKKKSYYCSVTFGVSGKHYVIFFFISVGQYD